MADLRWVKCKKISMEWPFSVPHQCHLIWPLAGEHEIVSPSSRMLLGEASPPYLAHIFLLERRSDWESMHACVHVEYGYHVVLVEIRCGGVLQIT